MIEFELQRSFWWVASWCLGLSFEEEEPEGRFFCRVYSVDGACREWRGLAIKRGRDCWVCDQGIKEGLP